MIQKLRKTLSAIVLVAILAGLAGCGSPTTAPDPSPQATQAAPQDTQAPPASGEPALTVHDQSFTLKQLQAMEQIEAEVDGTAYTGVRILDLLAAADLAAAPAILLVGRDGYSAEVMVAGPTSTSRCTRRCPAARPSPTSPIWC